MLEHYLLDAEKKGKVGWIFIITFTIIFITAIVNFFLGGNSLFLVSLVSLTLSYPVVNYVRSMNREKIELKMDEETLLRRHASELLVFWTIFVAAVVGLAVTFPFQLDFTFQEAFLSQITGYVTEGQLPFSMILLNNLKVLGFTFVISVISFSALIFVLIWNASIVVYSLSKYPSVIDSLRSGVLLIPHGLLEIGGYVMIAIAGSIIAYRIDRWKKFDHRMDVEFVKDVSTLIVSAIALVFVGAILEVL
jgi:uncharacterized membrane protein SpoIIM required for sporulation